MGHIRDTVRKTRRHRTGRKPLRRLGFFGQSDSSWDTNLCPQGREAGMLDGEGYVPRMEDGTAKKPPGRPGRTAR